MSHFFDKYLIKSICVLLFVFVSSLITLSPIYAQDDSSKQRNNSPPPSKEENSKTSSPVAKELIRVNKVISEKLDNAADGIDKGISPESKGQVESNKTQIYFIIGGDVTEDGEFDSNFRFGAKLHLPRFEKYWKLKFANQDEKKERGQSEILRERRTRNTADEIFVGVSFFRNWEDIEVRYEPQIAINDGVGLDHSIEAQTKYEFGKFNIFPSLEFFANHDEGTGSSAQLKFMYWIKKNIALEQLNDTRFLYIDSVLAVNHMIGIIYLPSDRLNFSAHYFRGYSNEERYELSAYGAYLATRYIIFENMLSAEVIPYRVREREENFEPVNGAIVNFKVIF